jgi:site-specific recombinase XerC
MAYLRNAHGCGRQPMRSLQEWMGHSNIQTTLIYADYQPSEHEAELVRRAFARGGITVVMK